MRPFHLDHSVFGTSEARLCAPRISSTESHSEQQWHANPRALNGLTCVGLTIHGGKEKRPARVRAGVAGDEEEDSCRTNLDYIPCRNSEKGFSA